MALTNFLFNRITNLIFNVTTPLSYAVVNKYTEIVKILLSNSKIDVNIPLISENLF